MPETITRAGISFMWNDTSRNSMVFIEESDGFVFISIDSNEFRREHLNVPSLPTPHFWRILRVEVASKGRRRTQCGQLQQELPLRSSPSLGCNFHAKDTPKMRRREARYIKMFPPEFVAVNRNEYETIALFNKNHRVSRCVIPHKRYSCPRNRFRHLLRNPSR